MANVYYKFNSELNFSHVGFDGLHISVGDLKKAILHQKRLGKTADFDLLISNAQTKEEYVEENCLIPKNTSLIVARVPVNTNQYSKRWEQPQPTHNPVVNEQSMAENVDLSKMNGSEEDKIQAMMVQSTLDYDPSSYQRVRGSTQIGEVPSSYRCHRCHKTGHWIKNCPMNPPLKDHYHKVRPESKKMTGIPRSLRENPPPNKVDPTENQKVIEEKKEPPEDLLCTICKGIFRDAVMIPCCGSSFCDECIRTALLESDDNECPECNEKGTSPGSLIPNRFLRTNVAAFLTDSNTTGNGREKHATESHEETPSRQVESSPQIDDLKETVSEPQKQDTQKRPEVESKHEKEQSHSEDDEDDDDDNITVTVPPASHQCGPVFRETPGMVRISHRSKEIHERHNTADEPSTQGGTGSENSHQKGGQYSDSSYYYNEPYNEQQPQSRSTQNSSYPPDEPENNYMAGPPSSGAQNSLYPPHNMYNQQAPTSQMPMRPQYGQYQGQPHQAPFYPQQQNVRPFRYDHHNNYQQPMRHHHHHGPHQQYPMHPGHGNYGMRYQRNDHNLANAVEHNIKQRFGSGVIEDPLEAFNKIMREKEMRKDRRRSPARFNEGRARSPVRKYSPDRYKSPQRRRKRTRSFSSNSSRSRSRSRSGDRHHERDYRKKHRVVDRNKPSDNSRSKHRNKSYDHSPDTRKVNHDNSSSTSALQEIKPTSEEQQNIQHQDELISNQPPPPGEEENIEETKAAELNVEQSRGDDEMRSSDEKANLKALKEKSVEKSPSSEDNKRSKKVRDKKKHKKSDKKSMKKKKRERKEKRSASRSITEDESILAKNVEATDDEKHQKELRVSSKEDDETSPATTSAFDKTATSSEQEIDEFKPELSKWEKEEIERHEEEIEVKRKSSKESRSDDGKATVTTEILKRAENVLFSKSSSNRLNKDSSPDRSKETSPLPSVIKKVDHEKKAEIYHVTVPVESGMRSVEMKSAQSSKSSKEPVRTSIKERLGKKVVERSRSRSRTPERKHPSMNNNKSSSSRQDSRKHLSSTISSVKSSSKSDTRSREPIRRRSRSYDRRDIKKYQRSRSKSSSRGRDRGNQRTDRHHRSREREPPRPSKVEPPPKPMRKEQKNKRRSDSPRSDDGNERKKMRSSSVESKKHKKKKKKEKKAKKKSRDRK